MSLAPSVALIANTAEPNSRLPGTVFTAAAEIEAAGGRALPIVGDTRDDAEVRAAVAATVGTHRAERSR
jgi:citronellol/citronellal dehydrogenase